MTNVDACRYSIMGKAAGYYGVWQPERCPGGGIVTQEDVAMQRIRRIAVSLNPANPALASPTRRLEREFG